jgi:proline racemase
VAQEGVGGRDGLEISSSAAYNLAMTEPARPLSDLDDDNAAELVALTAAVEKARANRRGVPHEEMRAWLLKLAAGNFDAPPPKARDL